MYIHVFPSFAWPPRAWPKGGGALSQLATGCVTCHTCHSCMTDFRPILGNPVEVTHVTSPGHIILSDKSHSSEGSSEGNHLESLHNYNFYSVFHKHIYQGNVERRT